MNQFLAVILAVLIGCPPALGQQSAADLKKKVLELPAGSLVEVRLVDKSKLRGRLGSVSDTGFDLQTTEGSKTGTQQIGFDGLTSIRTRKSAASAVGKGFLIAGITVAAFVGIVAIWCGTHHSCHD